MSTEYADEADVRTKVRELTQLQPGVTYWKVKLKNPARCMSWGLVIYLYGLIDLQEPIDEAAKPETVLVLPRAEANASTYQGSLL